MLALSEVEGPWGFRSLHELVSPYALTSTYTQNSKDVIRMQLSDAQTILQAWAMAYARTRGQHGAAGRSVPRGSSVMAAVGAALST